MVKENVEAGETPKVGAIVEEVWPLWKHHGNTQETATDSAARQIRRTQKFIAQLAEVEVENKRFVARKLA